MCVGVVYVVGGWVFFFLPLFNLFSIYTVFITSENISQQLHCLHSYDSQL